VIPPDEFDNDASARDSHRVSRCLVQASNHVVTGYDMETQRFFVFAADRLVTHARLKPGYKVLDVATGAGLAAIAAAQSVGPTGRVVAIDTAEQLLGRAQARMDKFGVANVDLHSMDAARIEFRAEYFDVVICSYALCLVSDMEATIRGWARVLKRGGIIAFSSFGAGAFEPMAGLLRGCVEDYDRSFSEGTDASPLQRLAARERCLQLLQTAGLSQPEVIGEQLGYHLRNPEEWWEVVWNSWLRGRLDRLEAGQIEALRKQHLDAVFRLMGTDGLWMNVQTMFSCGRKP